MFNPESLAHRVAREVSVHGAVAADVERVWFVRTDEYNADEVYATVALHGGAHLTVYDIAGGGDTNLVAVATCNADTAGVTPRQVDLDVTTPDQESAAVRELAGVLADVADHVGCECQDTMPSLTPSACVCDDCSGCWY